MEVENKRESSGKYRTLVEQERDAVETTSKLMVVFSSGGFDPYDDHM